VRPPAAAEQHARLFTGPRSHRIVPGAGHNLPQEKPQVFADAVLELLQQGLAP
jgi:pimeloyl-ACP methyl ester carboxylesterase